MKYYIVFKEKYSGGYLKGTTHILPDDESYKALCGLDFSVGDIGGFEHEHDSFDNDRRAGTMRGHKADCKRCVKVYAKKGEK